MRTTAVLTPLARRLRDERGIALVTALGVLFVLSIALVSIVSYTSANSRSSAYGRSEQQAHALAEAGVNNALAVLYNNPDRLTDDTLLAPQEQEYEGGEVEWHGEYVDTGEKWEWQIVARGMVKNPTGPGATDARETLRATARLSVPESEELQTPIWNWIYSGATGSECDTTLDQHVTLDAPLYVVGNLCMRSTAEIIAGPTVVEGNATLAEPKNAIGSSRSPVNEAFIGGWCQYKNFAAEVPCAPRGYNNPQTNIWATKVYTESPGMRIPPIEWEHWYLYASPGPRSGCTTSSGTPPVFDVREADGSLVMNNNVPGVFDLAPPSTSYTCRTRRGEISWNHQTKVLTVVGTVFIDGSAKIENGIVSSYDAFSSVYLSGTLLIKNSSMCAVVNANGNGCDRGNWNPNERMLIFAAMGTGGQVPEGMSIQLVSSVFQGGLYGVGSVSSGTTTQTQGPQVSEDDVDVGQGNEVKFPFIRIVPSGAPGNPAPPPELEDPEFG